MARRFRADAGVSLVEMLVVLALLALAMSLVAPSTRHPARGIELTATADAVSQRLREARARAIASARDIDVDFDTPRRQIVIAGADRNVQISSDIMWTLIAARPGGADGAGARITFYPDGSATGGTIDLTRDGRSVRIDVDWLTGDVRLAREPR